MSRSSTAGCLAAAATKLEELGWKLLAECFDRVHDVERGVTGRPDPAEVAEAQPAAPSAGLAVRVAARPVRSPLCVDDELASAAAIDVDRSGVISPRPQQDAGEADLAAGLGADPNRDLVEPLAASVLGVHIAAERLRDRGGKVAAASFWARS